MFELPTGSEESFRIFPNLPRIPSEFQQGPGRVSNDLDDSLLSIPGAPDANPSDDAVKNYLDNLWHTCDHKFTNEIIVMRP